MYLTFVPPSRAKLAGTSISDTDTKSLLFISAETLKKQAGQNAQEYNRLADEHNTKVRASVRRARPITWCRATVDELKDSLF